MPDTIIMKCPVYSLWMLKKTITATLLVLLLCGNAMSVTSKRSTDIVTVYGVLINGGIYYDFKTSRSRFQLSQPYSGCTVSGLGKIIYSVTPRAVFVIDEMVCRGKSRKINGYLVDERGVAGISASRLPQPASHSSDNYYIKPKTSVSIVIVQEK